MKTGIIMQARMSSRRFVGKVLHDVAGKPMLKYTLERLRHCRHENTIVVATSREDEDTRLVDFCDVEKVACYRGSLDNVADRFKRTIEQYQFDAFVRVNGDSPLLDQRLIDDAVKVFMAGEYDLVTNVMPRTYPRGQSVEVLRSQAFLEGCERMVSAEDLEHVTVFFYAHREEYRIRNLVWDSELSYVRLCVDTDDDMNLFSEIVARMDKPHWAYNLSDVMEIYRRIKSREMEKA